MKKRAINTNPESIYSDEEVARLRALFAMPVSEEEDVSKYMPPYRPPLKEGEVEVTMIPQKRDDGEEDDCEEYDMPVTFQLTENQAYIIKQIRTYTYDYFFYPEDQVEGMRHVEDSLALKWLMMEWYCNYDPGGLIKPRKVTKASEGGVKTEMTFLFSQDCVEVMETAFKLGKKAAHSKDDSVVLEYIALNFLMNREPEMVKDILDNLPRISKKKGVKEKK